MSRRPHTWDGEPLVPPEEMGKDRESQGKGPPSDSHAGEAGEAGICKEIKEKAFHAHEGPTGDVLSGCLHVGRDQKLA